jgi:gas vesicle protein
MEAFMADNDNSSIGWFLAGLGLGALVGVLFAPKSGRETRDSIAQSALEGRDYLNNRTREAREQVGQWADRGREFVNQQKDQFSSAVEAGKQAFRSASSGEGERR